jgi:hypothetical protein
MDLLRSPTFKKALLIILVVIVVLTGVPVLAGAGHMAMCDDCSPAVAACGPVCAALPAAVFALAVAMLMLVLRGRNRWRPALGFAWSLDPPPRLA